MSFYDVLAYNPNCILATKDFARQGICKKKTAIVKYTTHLAAINAIIILSSVLSEFSSDVIWTACKGLS